MSHQSRPPTSSEVIARQKADAEKARTRKASEGKSNRSFIGIRASHEPGEPISMGPAASALAAIVPDNRTSVEKYVDAIAPSMIAGKLVKFSKEGKFIVAESEEEISPDDDYTALCDETLVGWIKFNDDAPPDRHQGLLYDGFVMPARESLGDLDPTEWPAGLSGQPADPWQHQICLVLQSPKTQELFTFVTSSQTGRRAVGNLLRHYDRMRRTDKDSYPVVRLKPSGFAHRDERVGWVHVPAFAVVGRTPKNSATVPDTSTEADLNDSVPF